MRVGGRSVALNASLSGAIHDLQARLGSIRIAVSAVAELDLDDHTRNEMLTSASEESVRASAELSGISALTACLLDGSAATRCDVAATVLDAVDTARLAGLTIEVSAVGQATADVNEHRLRVALPALLRLVAGAGKQLRTSVAGEDVVTVRIDRAGDDADQESLPPVVDYLLDELGARRLDAGAGLAFSFPSATA